MIKCGQGSFFNVEPLVYNNDVPELSKNIVCWTLGQTAETETKLLNYINLGSTFHIHRHSVQMICDAFLWNYSILRM